MIMEFIKNKEFDFGNPDTKKNINTIYVNYKQPSDDHVQIQGIADGGAVTDIEVLDVSAGYTTKKLLCQQVLKV